MSYIDIALGKFRLVFGNEDFNNRSRGLHRQ